MNITSYGVCTMKKTAWTASDIGSELATGVAADIGIAGLLGAVGIGTGGATGLAGVGAGVAALATGPVGLVLLGVGATVAAAIYFGTQKTDDNISDLIERIEALDYEDTIYRDTVTGWIQQLGEYKSAMMFPMTATDRDQQVKQLSFKLAALVELRTLMNSMWSDWESAVKDGMKDWGADKSDFEYAFKNTKSALDKLISGINTKSQAVAAKILASNPEPVNKLFEEMMSIVTQIKKIWATPEFTEDEKRTIQTAAALSTGKINDPATIRDTIKKINILRNDLKQLLEEAKKRRKARGARDIDMEKVAVSLPDTPAGETSDTPVSKKKEPKTRVGPGIPKYKVTENLQFLINRTIGAFDIRTNTLTMDGKYGPNTAKALSTVISSSDEIKSMFKKVGITPESVMNIKLMNGYNGAFIGASARLLKAIHSNKTQLQDKENVGVDEKKDQQKQEVTYSGGGGCNWSKTNPTPKEQLDCLKTINIMVGGGSIKAYDYMRNLGYDEDGMITFIQNLYPGKKPDIWSPSTIARALGGLYG